MNESPKTNTDEEAGQEFQNIMSQNDSRSPEYTTLVEGCPLEDQIEELKGKDKKLSDKMAHRSGQSGIAPPPKNENPKHHNHEETRQEFQDNVSRSDSRSPERMQLVEGCPLRQEKEFKGEGQKTITDEEAGRELQKNVSQTDPSSFEMLMWELKGNDDKVSEMASLISGKLPTEPGEDINQRLVYLPEDIFSIMAISSWPWLLTDDEKYKELYAVDPEEEKGEVESVKKAAASGKKSDAGKEGPRVVTERSMSAQSAFLFSLLVFAIQAFTQVLLYNGKDCSDFNENIRAAYPKCVETVSVMSNIGNGVCDKLTNTEECGWDGEDCIDFHENYPECEAGRPSSVGNGHCSGVSYNIEACGYDDGDCEWFNRHFPDCKDRGGCASFKEKLPGCDVPTEEYIGNGDCDNGKYNTAECGWDGGDCIDFKENFPECDVFNPALIGDGTCHEDLNTKACKFDGGDCL